MSKGTPIQGLILDDDEQAEAVERLIDEVLVVVRLKGQSQVYAFDVTDNAELVKHIISEVEEEEIN